MAKASGLHSQDRSGNLGRVAICASITDLPVIAKAKPIVIGSAEPLEEFALSTRKPWLTSLAEARSDSSRRGRRQTPDVSKSRAAFHGGFEEPPTY